MLALISAASNKCCTRKNKSSLYYEALGWVFVIVYTLIGGLIVARWSIVRPGRHE